MGGPNVDFTDLPQAVAAAAPGDEIWLYRTAVPCAGWTAYTATAINKPLRIVGFSASQWGPGVIINGLITVSGIGTGHQVILSHMEFGTLGNPSSNPIGVDASNCQGDIIIEGADLISGGYGGRILRFTNCANVVLRHCTAAIGGTPVTAINSTLLMSNTLIGSNTPTLVLTPLGILSAFPQSSEGLRLINSTATIVASSIDGARNWSNPYGTQVWYPRPAVMLDNSTLEVGPGAALFGGYDGVSGHANSYHTFGTGLATIYKDFRGYIPQVPSIGYGPPPIPRDLHATTHNTITADDHFDVIVAGPPNGFAALLVGNYLSPPLSTSLGLLWLDPPSISLVTCQPLDAVEGRYNGTLFCPSGVSVGYAFALQSVVLGPTGSLSLTIPSPVVVGWPLGIPP